MVTIFSDFFVFFSSFFPAYRLSLMLYQPIGLILHLSTSQKFLCVHVCVLRLRGFYNFLLYSNFYKMFVGYFSYSISAYWPLNVFSFTSK